MDEDFIIIYRLSKCVFQREFKICRDRLLSSLDLNQRIELVEEQRGNLWSPTDIPMLSYGMLRLLRGDDGYGWPGTSRYLATVGHKVLAAQVRDARR
jgi:hypothetical protein